nr:unnamed protein product [Digitaria exilis]
MSVRLPGASKPAIAMAALSLPPLPHRAPPPAAPASSPPHSTAASLKRLCKEGDLRQALRQLTARAPPPREHYGWVLDLVAARRAAEEGRQVHAHALASGCLDEDDEGFLATKLVFMYGRCGRVDDARRLFDGMPARTVFSWNALVGAYLSSGSAVEAVRVYRAMRASAAPGSAPDGCTLASVLKACGVEGDGRCGHEVHGLAVKSGLDKSTLVANALIGMYAKCSMLDSALRVFEWLHDGRDVASWNSVITGCVQNGRTLEALELFRGMQSSGFSMNSYTAVGVLQVCAELALLNVGRELHAALLKCGSEVNIQFNALLVMYTKCGRVDSALKVFHQIDEKDHISWNSMLSCYIQNDLYAEAIDFFGEMLQHGFQPDHACVVSLSSALGHLGWLNNGREVHAYAIKQKLHTDLQVGNTLMDMYIKVVGILKHWKCSEKYRNKGLSHSKLVDEGKYYLDMMVSKYGLKPWQEHYACVVDILGRSGRTEEAYRFIESMPMEPTSVVWCALVGACRVHENHDLAVFAANKLLELEPGNPGNYILVSNVFAEMGKWNDVKKVRIRMAEQGLRKDPACSWIEIGNNIHTFTARDHSHRDSEAIHLKLAEIAEKLRKEGYKEDTRFVLHDVSEEEKIDMLHKHSERLAIAFGLISTRPGTPLRIAKNLRVCGDCHEFTKLVSKLFEREIVQKIVIKVSMSSEKSRSKAMELVAKADGVSSMGVTGGDKDQLEVIGVDVDTVCLVKCLRKKLGHADILKVEEVKDKKAEEKKKPEEPKIIVDPPPYYNYYPGYGVDATCLVNCLRKKVVRSASILLMEEVKDKEEEKKKPEEKKPEELLEWGWPGYYYPQRHPLPMFFCEEPTAGCHVM